MNKYIIILIIFLLFVVVLKNYNDIYNDMYNEHYKIVESDNTINNNESTLINIDTNINTSKYKDKDKDIDKNTLLDGVRKGSDPLDGQLFEDVIMYKNDNKLDGEIGVEKCIKKCKGMCVEYGVSGESFCYPKDYAPIRKELDTVNTELKNKF